MKEKYVRDRTENILLISFKLLKTKVYKKKSNSEIMEEYLKSLQTSTSKVSLYVKLFVFQKLCKHTKIRWSDAQTGGNIVL